jgi:hypothetical protein
MPARRFPPPWSIEELEACFVVRDHDGQKLAYVYFEDEPGRRAGYWFLWVRCPACHTVSAIDLRGLDRHPDAAVTSLIPALSCRSCRPNAPFAKLVRLSRTSIADKMREEHRRKILGVRPLHERRCICRLERKSR